MTSGTADQLPIDALRGRFEAASRGKRVVVSSPTGSGKSTQIPRWCPRPVLVVEPRRVACRSLAQRVAELEGTELGGGVGYAVRDEVKRSAATSILFVTPGVALRMLHELDDFPTVVLDEFHERRLDVDLLLALLLGRPGGLVVMSATLDGDRVADYLEGEHLAAEGRTHPVSVSHVAGKTQLPDVRGLEARLGSALEQTRDAPGDVLVFLPGKGEIQAALQALSGRAGVELIELHGGLTLEEQNRAWKRAERGRRKVILSTNVAETSITVPGVGVVIDSGLVRRTRYHNGRGFLTLLPVALDSAEQRAGRAGRTSAGVCLRLWSEAAILEARTPPEMYRESLVPLVLAAANAKRRVGELRFLDPPKEHAISSALEELRALGALSPEGELTDCGRQLFGLPIDPALGRLLVEARGRGDEQLLGAVVDLVAALAVGRSLFLGGVAHDDDDEDLAAPDHCDASALIRAVRRGKPRQHGLSRFALEEARANAKRLRRAFELPRRDEREPDRRAVLDLALCADPRVAHIRRERKREVAWSNGGTEISLGRESAANRAQTAEALVVLETRALGTGAGGRGARIVATAASPVPLSWLVAAGLGRDRVASVALERGVISASIERVYARKVLATREEEPTGELARSAVVELFLRGSILKSALPITRERLEAQGLAAKLIATQQYPELSYFQVDAPPPIEDWVAARVAELGIESASDVELLSQEDLTAKDLPEKVRAVLDREFPREVSLGDATYRARYDLERRQVVLETIRGGRGKPPPASYLPRFGGFRVFIEAGGTMHRLR